MTKLFRNALVIAVAASLGLCAGASAAIVTVGSTTTAGVTPATVGNPATLLNVSLGEPGAKLVSPVNGVILRWHATGFTGGPWRLRVLTPLGGLNYRGGGSSAPVLPASVATETFVTNLPIQAGQTIAVDNTNGSDKIGFIANPAGAYAFYVPPLGDGNSGVATGPFPGAQFTFNAEILPAPAVTSITPSSGSLKGGTVVSIFGTDFSEVKGVTFGAVPAAFAVNSDSLITAVAPPSAAPGPANVAVTTIAGTAGSALPFTYTACKVPSLKGSKLKGAKKRIRAGGCKVGNVTKPKGVTAKTGVVVKQNPKAGKILAPGAKVHVKLG